MELDFGPYEGRDLAWVALHDEGYLRRLAANLRTPAALRAEIWEFVSLPPETIALIEKEGGA